MRKYFREVLIPFSYYIYIAAVATIVDNFKSYFLLGVFKLPILKIGIFLIFILILLTVDYFFFGYISHYRRR